MNIRQFIDKWKGVTLSERSACQQHFLDICDLLQQPKPADVDPQGEWYTFERGVQKTDGGQGWADVWMRDHFGWEYKGKHKNLVAAYRQLLQYREDLENPPLLVVCDLDRFEIHTNFTGTVKAVYAFDLAGLAEPKNLDVLRKVFANPDALKPGQTPETVTKQAAELIGQLADGMRVRNIAAPQAAHFLMRVMFCMFAEDIDLLPGKLFSKLLEKSKNDPARLAKGMAELFQAMGSGGEFWGEDILYFNGGLFADPDVEALTAGEIAKLRDVARLDWSCLEPSIFGTLFERTLDPEKRSQIGAHYTSREDIKTLLDPVVMCPLRREWTDAQSKCDKLTADLAVAKSPAAKRKKIQQRDRALRDFVERLAHVTILDPACGSGNFLYVALHLLLDLEKEVISYAARHSLGLLPQVRPTQLAGIEVNAYAQELASVVIWIGYLQWMHHNGFNPPNNPVLEPIQSIYRMDAILDLSDPDNPREPEWPAVDFIVGNPPFLGDKMMRGGLGDDYVDKLRSRYEGRVPGQADLCCYWFEKARANIKAGKVRRAGLLATQGIRGGANRAVLRRICESGGIFFAVSDREWVLDGALVHISMVGFDDASESQLTLNGEIASAINANLTAHADTTKAGRIPSNANLGFLGSCKGGSFDIEEQTALVLLAATGNPHGKPNSDVIRPVVNSRDLLGRQPTRWIIDNHCLSLEEAAFYEKPHRLVEQLVKPDRDSNRDKWLRENWWRPQRMRQEMRNAISPLDRFLVTPTTSKHRVFVWMRHPTLPDHQLIVFASSEDYFFGVLHSRINEIWARAMGTQLREAESGFRYTPSTCFETLPLPEPTNEQRETIAAAAKELDRLRSNWLNPPEWTRQDVLEFPGSKSGPWARYVHEPDLLGIGTVLYPRLVPKDEDCAKELKQRTLTNLYNKRPTWLDMAHKRLDAAVFAAYGWDPAMSDDDLLAALLALNLERAREGQ
ncbi:MAG: class I SAM-dependent DNA methyltransferase [Planctomycetota bacterium]|nr:class I SAM-dependent DNA methyltransferase [Planctomycetota bacterium]